MIKIPADLIGRFGTIQNLYDEISTDTAILKPKVKEALKANKEKAFLSRELVKTVQDMEIDFHIDDCKFGNFDYQKLGAIFYELNFTTMMDKLSSIVF